MLPFLSAAIISYSFSPVYSGPTCAQLANCIATIPLEGSGLILEVADSLVANGGKGLFIRCEAGIESVRVSRATAMCGYAQGTMEATADSACGKTVAFALRQPSTAVFFEKELHTVSSLLDAGLSIAGHSVTRDVNGALTCLAVDDDYEGDRFFVPSQPQPEPSLMSLGQYANDLAVGGDLSIERGYSDESAQSNLLVLVQRLERDPSDATRLLPSRPISTIAHDITFENAMPMEVGCEYGERYWYTRPEQSE